MMVLISYRTTNDGLDLDQYHATVMAARNRGISHQLFCTVLPLQHCRIAMLHYDDKFLEHMQ